MTTRKKKIHWNPEYYLYTVLQPKREGLARDIDVLHKANKNRKNPDFHGIQAQAAYYCEIALKCLVAVLGEQPKTSTHNLKTLYSHASRLYSGDLDREIQDRIEKLARLLPVLEGLRLAEPSKVTDTAQNYYKKARYPRAVPPGQWSEPQLDPVHLFAVGDGVAALAVELMRSSSAAV